MQKVTFQKINLKNFKCFMLEISTNYFEEFEILRMPFLVP